VTSPGNSTAIQGSLPKTAASPAAVNQLLSGLPSKAFSGPQVGQKVLQVIFNLPAYSLINPLEFSSGWARCGSSATASEVANSHARVRITIDRIRGTALLLKR
jgi:hypothetical protein